MKQTILLSFFLTASAVAQTVTISAPVFVGSGLNDASKCGTFSSAAANEQFVVTLSATGTPDHFTWTKNSGAASSPIAITGACQVMADGVGIQFAATTGHTLAVTWTINTTANGSATAMSFVQQGMGAIVSRPVQDKLRETASVLDFGAKCDGITNDTAAIQNALNALTISISKLTLPSPLGKPCGVTGTVYVPSYAAGAVIEAYNAGSNSNGNYPFTSGLIALSGSPFEMFKIYAPNVAIQNLVLHCNGVAERGFVFANAGESRIENSGADSCLDDGTRIDLYGGPATTSTTSITGGTAGGSITVASAALPGQSLGQLGCTGIELDYGTTNQEALGFTAAGNVLTTTGTFAHSHSGTYDVRCQGNNDGLKLRDHAGLFNGGFGIDMEEGPDNNAVILDEPFVDGNAAGGGISSGSGGHLLGGHFEGNGGVGAWQLGDVNGGNALNNGRVTFGWTIIPPSDIEANSVSSTITANVTGGTSTTLSVAWPGSLQAGSAINIADSSPETVTVAGTYTLGSSSVPLTAAVVHNHVSGAAIKWSANAITAYCDGLSFMLFQGTSQLLVPSFGPYCPSAPVGSSTVGTGRSAHPGSGAPQLQIMSALGVAEIEPGNGEFYYNPSGTQIFTNRQFGQILTSDLQITQNSLNVLPGSAQTEYAFGFAAKANLPIHLFDGSGHLKVSLDASGGTSVFSGAVSTGTLQATGLSSSGTQCAAINSAGTLIGAGAPCGSASAITALTGDGTAAGPGSAVLSVSKVNGGAFPTSATVMGTNGSSQPTAATTTGSGSVVLASAASTTVNGTTCALGSTCAPVPTVNNHKLLGGSAPTASGCGTSPSILSGSTDNAGSVQFGTGTVTGCTVNFATTFTSSPNCTVNLNVVTGQPVTVSTNTSILVIGLSASSPGNFASWSCW